MQIGTLLLNEFLLISSVTCSLLVSVHTNMHKCHICLQVNCVTCFSLGFLHQLCLVFFAMHVIQGLDLTHALVFIFMCGVLLLSIDLPNSLKATQSLRSLQKNKVLYVNYALYQGFLTISAYHPSQLSNVNGCICLLVGNHCSI